MKMTVIGYWHGYPTASEATSGYLFEHDGYSLLVDCGSGVLSNLQAYTTIEQLDAVILSHYHQDHIADIGVLRYSFLINHKLDKFHSPLSIYGHNEDVNAFSMLAYEPYVKAHAYQKDSQLTLGPFTIQFCKTNHTIPCYALRIETDNQSVVYTADSSYIPELVTFAQDCDLLISECTFYEDQEPKFGHMNSKDCGTLAQKSGSKQLLLTHLPHYGDHQKLLKEAGQYYQSRIDLASKGWSFELSS